LKASSQKKLPKEVGLSEGLEGGVRSPLDPILKLPTDIALGLKTDDDDDEEEEEEELVAEEVEGEDMHVFRLFLLPIILFDATEETWGGLKRTSLVMDRET
jgi:hypothetical protein